MKAWNLFSHTKFRAPVNLRKRVRQVLKGKIRKSENVMKAVFGHQDKNLVSVRFRVTIVLKKRLQKFDSLVTPLSR